MARTVLALWRRTPTTNLPLRSARIRRSIRSRRGSPLRAAPRISASPAAILLFMGGGTRRQRVPGRGRAAVELIPGFVDNIPRQNIGAEGRRYLPWVFTAFIFILFSNWIGAMPFAIVPGGHPFTVT